MSVRLLKGLQISYCVLANVTIFMQVQKGRLVEVLTTGLDI